MKSTIEIPSLDDIDVRVHGGETVDGREVLRLTSALRRLVELIVDGGGGGLIGAMKEGGDG